MPAKNTRDLKRLKQTTLFDSPRLLSNRKSSTSKVTKDNSAKPAPSDGGIQCGPSKSLTVVSSDDEDVPSPSKLTRKRRIPRLASESSSEEPYPSALVASSSQVDSDDMVPSKRRRLRRRRSVEDASANGDDDTDDLANEVDEEDILDTRLRTRNKESSYQKNLEKLKRRKIKDQSSSENEDASDELLGSPTPFKGAKPSSELNGSEDEILDSGDSSDFIVEDDNVFQLPAQFSMESHQDLSHQFKQIFQFFVHIAVQPPKRRSSFMKKKLAHEEYFSVPLQTMRRKLLGIRDSLVASSVWKPTFKKDLERYPEFSLTELCDAVPSCDACRLGGRMSTLMGRLTGSRYDLSGFGPLPSDESEDDECIEYHLGRFCAKRTRVYHEFSHWEYELFQCISRELEELRSSVHGNGFHRIAYLHGTEPPDDLSDADELCNWLDQRYIIEREWQKLEALMGSAHRLEFHSKNGEDE